MYEFKWIGWNVEKCLRHGVTPDAAEYVIQNARSPYPTGIDDDKILVCGQSEDGQYLQVIFLVQEDGVLFVIHARPMTEKEKHRYRKRMR